VDVVSHLDEAGGMEQLGTIPAKTRLSRTAAVSELFRVHHRRLVGLASLLVDDHGSAEAVVQDAFVNLYRHWRSLRDPNGAVPYLNRCVVDASRDRLRRKGRYAAGSRTPAGLW
jgi:DNA-directed RNA polymerase specialized sigma24 family protein